MFSVKRIMFAVMMAAVLTAAMGCGGGGEREELLALVDAGDFDQVRSQAAALRQAGTMGPWLDYAEGLACLHGGEEQLARRLLAEAAAADPSLAPTIAETWATSAQADYEAGFRDRGRERMVEAVLIDPTTDPGPLLPAVADFLYRFVKNYDAAYPLYERLYRERPEPVSRHPEWVYRWGHSRELKGDLDGAREIYEEFIATWPGDMKQGRFVHWRYMTVLMEQAESARQAGDLDRALELLEMTRLEDWHLDQQERAEYMAGQIREQRGEFDLAREHYEIVLLHAEKVGSEVVDPARERLEALNAHDAN